MSALTRAGVDLSALLLAWARVLPTVVLVPAFGGKLLPAPTRVVLGLAFAVILTPSISVAIPDGGLALGVAFVVELLRGLPLALSTAALLWAAMMAGGLADDLRGGQAAPSGIFPDAPTPLATLLGLFASGAFLELGGAARVVGALSDPPDWERSLLLRVSSDLVSALGIAVSLAAPLLGAVIVWEVLSALVTRTAQPAHTQAMLSPLRSLLVLAVLAVSLESLFVLLTQLISA